MGGKVVIDCFPESAARYRYGYAAVVIDVIRATTTATTAVALGRRVFPVQTTDEAFVLAETLSNPLLAGELGGNMPYGFEITNSPAQIAQRNDIDRPMILLSTSGTQLLLNTAGAGNEAVYTACFRNLTAIAKYIAARHKRVAILGAGTRGQFRREDQMGCAWLAERLVQMGFEPESAQTEEYIGHWKGVSPEEVRGGRSAAYLTKTEQTADLEFVLGHFDDLAIVPTLINRELVAVS
ncbi:MAG TPA: 2-phosphosulfolactate phosphatase [Dissulfurispiraceae bacterium]|nr:2-phosphosulfolactate phosphatase [Dissulfurispiraceae bacterium]